MTTMEQAVSIPRQGIDSDEVLRDLCDRVTARLTATVSTRRSAAEREDAASDAIDAVIGEHAVATMRDNGKPLPRQESQRLKRALMAKVVGTGGFAPLLADDSIEDIWCNGCDSVWVRRADGTEEPVHAVADSDDDLID
ncbi:MAG: hypothetical protein ACRD0P_13065, partial [Stackebrandtia sp.]